MGIDHIGYGNVGSDETDGGALGSTMIIRPARDGQIMALSAGAEKLNKVGLVAVVISFDTHQSHIFEGLQQPFNVDGVGAQCARMGQRADPACRGYERKSFFRI